MSIVNHPHTIRQKEEAIREKDAYIKSLLSEKLEKIEKDNDILGKKNSRISSLEREVRTLRSFLFFLFMGVVVYLNRQAVYQLFQSAWWTFNTVYLEKMNYTKVEPEDVTIPNIPNIPNANLNPNPIPNAVDMVNIANVAKIAKIAKASIETHLPPSLAASEGKLKVMGFFESIGIGKRDDEETALSPA